MLTYTFSYLVSSFDEDHATDVQMSSCLLDSLIVIFSLINLNRFKLFLQIHELLLKTGAKYA